MSASREKRQRQQERKDPSHQNKKKKAKQFGGIPRWIKRTVASVLCVAVVLLIAYWVVGSMGVFQRAFTAMTVGDESVSAAEFNYYYYMTRDNFISRYSMTDSPEIDEMYKQDLMAQAEEELHNNMLLAADAEANGMTLSDENQKTIDDNIQSLKNLAATEKMSANRLLEEYYGTGMTEEIFRKMQAQFLLAMQWGEKTYDEFTYDDTEVESSYEEQKDELDAVNYRMVFFYPDRTVTYDNEEQTGGTVADATEDQMEKAKSDAEAMDAKITDEQSLIDLQNEYPQAPGDTGELNVTQTAPDTLREDQALGGLKESGEPTEALYNYLKDAGRKSGDHGVIEIKEDSGEDGEFVTGGYVLVYFLSRDSGKYKPVSGRACLVAPVADTGEDDYDEDEAVETAKQEADDLLAEWKSGERTEESFAQICSENSDDTQTVESGGELPDMNKGAFYADEKALRDWFFDPVRKPGDTAVVDTERGFFVAYFTSVGEEDYWQMQAEDSLRTTDYDAYLEEMKKETPMELNDFGLSFAGTRREREA